MNKCLKIALVGLFALNTVACGESSSDSVSSTAQPVKKSAEPVKVLSESAKAGQSLYGSRGCIGCHGPGGQSRNPGTFPVLAGKQSGYLAEQLLAFKTYKRRNAMMTSVAVNLQEEEITQLAAYLSEQ